MTGDCLPTGGNELAVPVGNFHSDAPRAGIPVCDPWTATARGIEALRSDGTNCMLPILVGIKPAQWASTFLGPVSGLNDGGN